MHYLVMAFDAEGSRVLTESAATAAGVNEVRQYAVSRGAATCLVYRQVTVLNNDEVFNA